MDYAHMRANTFDVENIVSEGKDISDASITSEFTIKGTYLRWLVQHFERRFVHLLLIQLQFDNWRLFSLVLVRLFAGLPPIYVANK